MEPASEPAVSKAPGWTACQCLKTASNRTCWKSSSILVWKSTFFSSFKPKLASKHTCAYFCTVKCLQWGPGARGWGTVPLSTPKWSHDSVPRHRHPCCWQTSFWTHLWHLILTSTSPLSQSFALLPSIHWTTLPMSLQPPNRWRGERQWSVWKAAGAQ